MPETEFEEIAQNVRVIMSTLKGTVPMDRGFGVDASIIDLPMSAARARITAEIAEAVAEAEPRAKVKRVDFTNASDGEMSYAVVFEVGGIS